LIITADQNVGIRYALGVNKANSDLNSCGLQPSYISRGTTPAFRCTPKGPTPIPKKSDARSRGYVHPDAIIPGRGKRGKIAGDWNVRELTKPPLKVGLGGTTEVSGNELVVVKGCDV
jgi:hypothetical protein